MSRDIPPIPESTDPDLKRPLQRIREELQRLLGLRGDPSEAALRVGGNASSGGGKTIIASGGSGSGGSSYTPDLTPPPTPTSLTVLAGFGQIVVTWDGITYPQGNGHKRTLIYAVKRDPTSTAAPPTFGDAPLVADAPNALTIISLPSDPNTKWHVWAKFETNDGVVSVSPAGGTNGAQGTTGQDIAGLLVTLAGQITAGELHPALSGRIDLVDGPVTTPGTVAARVKAEADARVLAIAQEVIDRNLAVAGGVSSAATYTQSYAYQKAAGEQLAIDFTALAAVVSNPTTGLAATRATLISSYATQSSVTDAIATATTSLQAYANTAASGAQSNAVATAQNYTTSYAYAKTNGEALANSVATLSSKVDAPSATPGNPAYNPTYAGLQTTQTTLATLDGRASTAYNVRTQITAGGRTVIGGFGLMGNSAAAPGSEIEFGVLANRFWVGAPAGSGIADSQFFTLQTTTWTDNGVTRPAGMFVDAAFIKNLSALYATIANLVADDITAANISASQITAGALRVGGYLQSTNYTGGPTGTGWRINADGTADLQAAYIRGQLSASQINAWGLSIYSTSGALILDAGQTLNSQVSAAAIGAVKTDLTNAPGGILNSGIYIDAQGRIQGIESSTSGTAVSNSQLSLTATGVLMNGGAFQGRVVTIDTRDDGPERTTDRPPSWYPVGTTREFKASYAVGLGGADNYLTLETVIQYGDSSGGSCYQYAYRGTTTWRRWGSCGANSWAGAWVQDLDRNAYTGHLDATLGAPTGTPVGDTTAENVAAVAAAVQDPSTGLAAKLTNSGTQVLGAALRVNTVSVPVGMAVGTLTWDAAGNRTGGAGIALTPAGIVGHNGTQTTFSMDAGGGNLVLRGTVYASAGQIGGNNLGADYIQSSNFVAGSTGWRVKSDGVAEFSSITLRNVTIADPFTVSITGSLLTSVANGTATYGTLSASVTGGTGTLRYEWATGYELQVGTLASYGISGGGSTTSTATIVGMATNNRIYGYITLRVTDANGRVAIANRLHQPIVHGSPPPL
jgi:hypothetical protein